MSLESAKVLTARVELYSLQTLTLTDKQFLVGAVDDPPVHIGAELRLPPGTAQIQAVVLIHGSGGVGANVVGWANQFNALGVAAFVLDSFTGRGIAQTITDQSQLSSFSMILDAYRALELLVKHPRIDPARIAVMGFSKGGFAALYSSMRRFQKMWAPADVEFSAYFPFYARCDTPFIDDENVTDHPIRFFHGAADDYVPANSAKNYAQRLKQAGKDVEIMIYEGALHSFDNPSNSTVFPLPDAVLLNNCRCAETEPGVILNLDTEKPFTWNDAVNAK
jgi:dienelactone hydrolase